MSTKSISYFTFPTELQINDQVDLRRIVTQDKEITEAAKFFKVSADEMKQDLKQESLFICAVVKQKTENIGYLALERFYSVKDLENRIIDKKAAHVIFNEQHMNLAASMYLNTAHCGQGIGSKIVETLREQNFPWMQKVFQMVDNKNKASTALQRKFGMKKITSIYIPSYLERIFCCCKLGRTATAYKMAKDI